MAVSWCMVEVGGRLWRGGRVTAQSRQSAKLFVMSSELGLPHPLTPCECVPPPLFGEGGTHSLAREGVGKSQFQLGDRHYGTGIYILCG